ncbi:hypothetical protein ABPG75_010187 [Micractinium tetrahymenae]
MARGAATVVALYFLVGVAVAAKCIEFNVVTERGPGGCAECSADAQRCLKCVEGFGWIMKKDGTCKECTPWCTDCLNETNCKVCAPGYRRMFDGRCEACTDPACEVCTLTRGVCEKCYGSYGLCPKAVGFCTECAGGYVSVVGKCQPCKVADCQQCLARDPKKCTACYSYAGGVDAGTGKCRPCKVAACIKCASNYASCGICESGYNRVRQGAVYICKKP